MPGFPGSPAEYRRVILILPLLFIDPIIFRILVIPAIGNDIIRGQVPVHGTVPGKDVLRKEVIDLVHGLSDLTGLCINAPRPRSIQQGLILVFIAFISDPHKDCFILDQGSRKVCGILTGSKLRHLLLT